MMEELVSPTVQVVLTIKEGRGFQQVLQPTAVVATLNGHCLETDVIESNANPQYATDLVWEVDKTRLRKMRAGHAPLKLECFAYKNNEIREKIGYLLLSIRSAQIIHKNSPSGIKAGWQKLLGLRNDLKHDKPELFIGFSINEPDSNITIELPQKQFQEHNLPSSELQHISPVLIPEMHLIQLGPFNTCQEIFILSVTATTASNVDQLLSTNELQSERNDELTLLCKIFESDVYFKPISGDCKNTITLDEKIVVRIRSSLPVLRKYLESKPHILMYLKCKEVIVGQSEVDLKPLVSAGMGNNMGNSNETSSNVKTARCFFRKNALTGDKVEAVQQNTYMDLELRLQYLGSKSDLLSTTVNPVRNSESEPAFNIQNYKTPSEISLNRNAGGDSGNCNGRIVPNFANSYHQINGYGLEKEILKPPSRIPVNLQSSDPMIYTCNTKHRCNGTKVYNCYYLNILLTGIRILSSKYTESNIEVRFHHPKAGVVSKFYHKTPVLAEMAKLQHIACKLHFVSTAEEIKNLLISHPPKISLHESEKNRMCIAESEIDVTKLFYQNKCESQYIAPLYDFQQTHIADLEFTLRLEDHGPHYTINENEMADNLGPPILDDNLLYKAVEELESWKERQKEIFKFELKRKEERHLNLLGFEWQKQKENLESKLACSVEQCKMLANSLNNATEDLKTRRLKSLEKEARLIKANEDLQWRYENKLQELRDSSNSVQEELKFKINTLEKQKISLEAQFETLTLENERLRSMVKKQGEELESYQKGSLTQDQTTNLLQELKILEEKLQNALESKSFFKEQWAKAVREIHCMKMEAQQAIHVQIKNSKEELQNLNLDEILQVDSEALRNDKILLEQIRREVDSLTPKPSSDGTCCHNQLFAPTNSLNAQSMNKPSLNKMESNNGRLQALIEERDTLLRTGSYSADDALIMTLNAEIRNLMVR